MAADSFMVQYESNNKKEEPLQRQQVRLTPEEIRILKDCNRESFYYRCLPFALTAMAATHIGVKKGFLKPHPKFGSTLKQIAAGFIGWFGGKISYRSACEDKFVNLPNSSIGEAIRKKRGYTISEFQRESTTKTGDVTFRSDDSEFLPDQNYNSSSGALNLDTDKNIQAPGLDDRERPTTDSFMDMTVEEQPQRPPVTYSELRQQNREEYERQFRTQQSPISSSSSSRMWDSMPRRTEFQNEGLSRRSDYQTEGIARRADYQTEGIARRTDYQTEGIARRTEFKSDSYSPRSGFQNEGPSRNTYGD